MDRDSVEPHVETLLGPNARQWIASHRERAAPSTTAYEFVWDLTEDAIEETTSNDSGSTDPTTVL